jgi:uncharacterized protein (UPF0261 family)
LAVSSPSEKVEFAEQIEEEVAWCAPVGAAAVVAGGLAVAAVQEAPLVETSSIVRRAAVVAGLAVAGVGATTVVHYARMRRHASRLRQKAERQRAAEYGQSGFPKTGA